MDYTKLPLFAEAEIVVCGGGTAGAFAAISAGKMGRDILVVESLGSLGGTATNGLVLPVMSTHIKGEPQCSYISNLVRERLLSVGAVDERGANFDPIMLKTVLEELCVESGVRILYNTFIAEAVVSDGRVTDIVVANKNGLGRIRAKIFIDATGDADVCVRAGAEYTKGNPKNGKNQPISLRYIVSGVDYDEFGRQLNEEASRTGLWGTACYSEGVIYAACCVGDDWALNDIFLKAIENGDLLPEDKAYWQGFSVTGRRGCIAFNNPEFFVDTDGTNPEHLTKAQIKGKKAIARQLAFCKKYLRGFENAYVSDIASLVGVRESRNVKTEYVLTAEDLLKRMKFDDMFCQSCYPVDIHGGVFDFDPSGIKPLDDGKPWYEIPFRSLVVKGFDNLMVAGRCLGAEFLAQSSLRVQHSVRSSGEAAGIGASLAIENGINPRDVDGKEVRNIMIKNGAVYA